MEMVDLSAGGFVADFNRTLYLISRDHHIAHSARGAAPAFPENRAASNARRQLPSPQPLAGHFAEESLVGQWEREYAAPRSLAQ
jgi:hypothetical protein